MEEQILWLAREREREFYGSCDYTLYEKRPRRTGTGRWVSCRTGCSVFGLMDNKWEFFFPALTLKPGECIKVKLTQTTLGIRLERL